MNLVFSMSDKPISQMSDEKNILIFFPTRVEYRFSA